MSYFIYVHIWTNKSCVFFFFYMYFGISYFIFICLAGNVIINVIDIVLLLSNITETIPDFFTQVMVWGNFSNNNKKLEEHAKENGKNDKNWVEFHAYAPLNIVGRTKWIADYLTTNLKHWTDFMEKEKIQRFIYKTKRMKIKWTGQDSIE